MRTFDVDWKENRDWLEYASLAYLYFKNAESLKGVLLAIIQEQTKSSDETLDEWCRKCYDLLAMSRNILCR